MTKAQLTKKVAEAIKYPKSFMPPPYAESIASAWFLVELVTKTSYYLELHQSTGKEFWTCEISDNLTDPYEYVGQEKTAPEAICAAFLNWSHRDKAYVKTR